MFERIYLDYNASTPIAPEAVEAMTPFLTQHYGNPSSRHWAGKPAREAVDRARQQVADLIAAKPEEIVFTGGGTEASNHAIKGAFFANRDKGNHIITTRVEHPATLEPCKFLETLGAEITYLPVDRCGAVSPDDVRKAITDRTILVSIMHANNEVGTINPIAEISEAVSGRGVLLHTDAAQSLGKISGRVDELGVDLMSIAGQKLYAPKGVGALYVRAGTRIEPLLHGAGHESGRRSGTENVLLIVGLGAACEVAAKWIGMPEIKTLRDHFWDALSEEYREQVSRNGHPEYSLPNTLSVNFVGRIGVEVLSGLEGVAASTGAACHSGRVELSRVLAAMGVPEQEGMGAIRFSLGRGTTADQIESVVSNLKRLLR